MVRYYKPARDRPVEGLVALVSDKQGWDAAADKLAAHLVDNGHAVLGVDLAAYLATITQDKGDCTSVNMDFEVLSRRVEEGLPFREFRPPVVLGIGAGSGIAYAAVGEAPCPTRSKVASGLGFTPAFDIGRKLCLPVEPAAPGSPVRYAPVTNRETAWLFTPDQDFAAPERRHEDVSVDDAGGPCDRSGNRSPHRCRRRAAANPGAQRLPLVGQRPADRRGAAARRQCGAAHACACSIPAMAAGGISTSRSAAIWPTTDSFVVGFDSLRYFWREKQPAEMASDLDKLIRHYAAQTKGKGVILAGYSFGADVLPFIVNRMASDVKREIKLISLLGVSQRASFVIRLEGILGAANNGRTADASGTGQDQKHPDQCVYGSDEKDSVCTAPELDKVVNRVAMAGNHHFNGDYRDTADTIIAAANTKTGK